MPGEAIAVEAGRCLSDGAAGSARVRGTTPLAIAVDTYGPLIQTGYTAVARDVRTMHGGPLFSSDASAFLHAPLVYKNYLVWTSRIRVQNASRDVTATLKASERHDASRAPQGRFANRPYLPRANARRGRGDGLTSVSYTRRPACSRPGELLAPEAHRR